MGERVWIVQGWDGDIDVFRTQEAAERKMARRVVLVDECELLVEKYNYLEYLHYDKILKQTYSLTLAPYKVRE